MGHTYGQLSKIFQRKIAIIFLSISLNMCFGCSKEQSHRDGSFEYQQHMFWLKNKKIIFSNAPLSGGLVIGRNFINFSLFMSLKIVCILVNSADPDVNAAFHLGLYCLQKYLFRGTLSTA